MGVKATAPLPPGAGESALAPRLKALLSLLAAPPCRLSRRTVEGLMSDFFDVGISLGPVSAREEAVSEAVAAPVAEAREYVEKVEVGGDVPGEGGDDARRRPAGAAAADADTGARCSRSGISGPGGVN